MSLIAIAYNQIVSNMSGEVVELYIISSAVSESEIVLALFTVYIWYSLVHALFEIVGIAFLVNCNLCK